MDRRLNELVRAVEATDKVSQFSIVVQTGGALVIGKPAASRLFQNLGRDYIWTGFKNALRKRPEAEQQAAFFEAITPYDEGFAAPEESPTALTLSEVEWWPFQGSGLELPVIRIPLDSIDAWWVNRGKLKKAGGGWFVGAGVSVPLDT